MVEAVAELTTGLLELAQRIKVATVAQTLVAVPAVLVAVVLAQQACLQLRSSKEMVVLVSHLL
jgi:hypothetical protein